MNYYAFIVCCFRRLRLFTSPCPIRWVFHYTSTKTSVSIFQLTELVTSTCKRMAETLLGPSVSSESIVRWLSLFLVTTKASFLVAYTDVWCLCSTINVGPDCARYWEISVLAENVSVRLQLSLDCQSQSFLLFYPFEEDIREEAYLICSLGREEGITRCLFNICCEKLI